MERDKSNTEMEQRERVQQEVHEAVKRDKPPAEAKEGPDADKYKRQEKPEEEISADISKLTLTKSTVSF